MSSRFRVSAALALCSRLGLVEMISVDLANSFELVISTIAIASTHILPCFAVTFGIIGLVGAVVLHL